jgi:lysophospholipase L1-like esterase
MNMKNLTANCLLALVSVALSVLLLEQSYRVYLFGGAAFSMEKMNSIHPFGDSGLLRPASNPAIVYELKPDVNSYFKLAKLKTNSNGLRDKEYALSKSGEVFRAAVIGDSFTMPAGVEIDEAYHSLLEERLNREQRESTYEFINFGVGGYDLRQYLAVMRFKAREYDPDLIIVGFCPENDHKISLDKIFQQQYKVRPATYPFFNSFVLASLEKLLGTGDNRDRRYAESSDGDEEQYMNHLFSEMSALSEENNIPIVIVYLDTVYNATVSRKIESLVVDNGLHYLNASTPFAGVDSTEYAIYPIDNHPNGKANRIFSEQLYGYLNKENLLERTATRSD